MRNIGQIFYFKYKFKYPFDEPYIFKLKNTYLGENAFNILGTEHFLLIYSSFTPWGEYQFYEYS